MIMWIYLDDWVGMDSRSRRTHGMDTLALNLQYTTFCLFAHIVLWDVVIHSTCVIGGNSVECDGIT